MRAFHDYQYKNYTAPFTFMVKSGEVHKTERKQRDDEGYLFGVKERARGICNPCAEQCGLTTAL